MKKVLASILALLYFSTSVGATVNIHYCMDRMVGWSLINDASDTCDTCGMKKSITRENGCCKDDIKVIKNTSDQKINTTSLLFTSPEVFIAPGEMSLEHKILRIPEALPTSNGPPLLHPEGIYLLHHCFRI